MTVKNPTSSEEDIPNDTGTAAFWLLTALFTAAPASDAADPAAAVAMVNTEPRVEVTTPPADPARVKAAPPAPVTTVSASPPTADSFLSKGNYR